MSRNRFADGIAVVTGGASGIGAAVVQRLVEEGASHVFVADLRTEQRSSSPRVTLVEMDVTRERDWQRLAGLIQGQFGRLDVLVNSVGMYLRGSLSAESRDSLSRSFEVNQLGPVLGIQALRGLLEKSAAASVCNVSSGAALFGFQGALGYMMSKWGLRGGSRALARELAPKIRVNSVYPGLIDTPMAHVNPSDSIAAVIAQTPLGRMGDPAEVADAIVFLCSHESSYITGAELTVDGGITT